VRRLERALEARSTRSAVLPRVPSLYTRGLRMHYGARLLNQVPINNIISLEGSTRSVVLPRVPCIARAGGAIVLTLPTVRERGTRSAQRGVELFSVGPRLAFRTRSRSRQSVVPRGAHAVVCTVRLRVYGLPQASRARFGIAILVIIRGLANETPVSLGRSLKPIVASAPSDLRSRPRDGERVQGTLVADSRVAVKRGVALLTDQVYVESVEGICALYQYCRERQYSRGQSVHIRQLGFIHYFGKLPRMSHFYFSACVAQTRRSCESRNKLQRRVLGYLTAVLE
jgi:hypothetical protein